MFTRFRHTRDGIRPEPLRAHVWYVGLLCDRELLGEVVETVHDDAGRLCLRVRHFNGEPWPITPPMHLVCVLDRTWTGSEGREGQP